jgi:hypothetical protein
MKIPCFLRFLLVCVSSCAAQELPRLSIKLQSPQVARIAWPATAADWTLTSTPFLPNSVWQPVNAFPQYEGSELAVLVPATDARRFFRLEKTCAFKATPDTIAPGGTSLLTWCERPGGTYTLFPGPAAPVTGGSFQVSPTATTTYFLIAMEGGVTTPSTVTVTVTGGGNTCPFAAVTAWDGTLNFSYELTPSKGDWSFVIRQEAHLSFHLTRTQVTPLAAEFSGIVSGNAQLNDRAEEAGTPPQIRTVVGNGAPQSSTQDDRVSRFYLYINCQTNTWSILIIPTITATATDSTGNSANGLWSVGKVDVRDKPLPQTVGALSGNRFLPARGPTWTGTTDHYHPGGFGDVMFFTNTVTDETAGSASVNWSLTPVP